MHILVRLLPIFKVQVSFVSIFILLVTFRGGSNYPAAHRNSADAQSFQSMIVNDDEAKLRKVR